MLPFFVDTPTQDRAEDTDQKTQAATASTTVATVDTQAVAANETSVSVDQ